MVTQLVWLERRSHGLIRAAFFVYSAFSTDLREGGRQARLKRNRSALLSAHKGRSRRNALERGTLSSESLPAVGRGWLEKAGEAASTA
jgi:hypothetical protein